MRKTNSKSGIGGDETCEPLAYLFFIPCQVFGPLSIKADPSWSVGFTSFARHPKLMTLLSLPWGGSGSADFFIHIAFALCAAAYIVYRQT